MSVNKTNVQSAVLIKRASRKIVPSISILFLYTLQSFSEDHISNWPIRERVDCVVNKIEGEKKGKTDHRCKSFIVLNYQIQLETKQQQQ